MQEASTEEVAATSQIAVEAEQPQHDAVQASLPEIEQAETATTPQAKGKTSKATAKSAPKETSTEQEKIARPRRPRGRPPKKTSTGTE